MLALSAIPLRIYAYALALVALIGVAIYGHHRVYSEGFRAGVAKQLAADAKEIARIQREDAVRLATVQAGLNKSGEVFNATVTDLQSRLSDAYRVLSAARVPKPAIPCGAPPAPDAAAPRRSGDDSPGIGGRDVASLGDLVPILAGCERDAARVRYAQAAVAACRSLLETPR